jgi:pimeloyl-ACP methyl ester carboxylesterase
MLHGILGRRRNLLGFARRFVAAFPKFRVLLVDHRNHGDSQGFAGPHTQEACARDLRQLVTELNIQPYSLVGHSFGAGVAVTYAKNFGNIESLWLLDAVPSLTGFPRPLDSSIEKILYALTHCSPTPSKEEFGHCLQSNGLGADLIGWLSMNLTADGPALRFRPEPEVAREMLEDFRKRYVIEDFSFLDAKVTIVRAERTREWQGAVSGPIGRLASAGIIEVFDLPDSGHYVHIDNPLGILDLMQQDFA